MTALMIQGTGSNVGKSVLVTGLCRAARLRGLSVAPFKPQNMSNTAAVTADGGEIGRAQALQALACGLAPHTDMNPILLKPETETGAQVVVQGRRRATVKAGDYGRMKADLMTPVLDSFRRLASAHDLVIVEGAGSPAEVNLRQNDIANMGFAAAADLPVVVAGDIEVLLVEWLSDLLYLFEITGQIYIDCEISTLTSTRLEAHLIGRPSITRR